MSGPTSARREIINTVRRAPCNLSHSTLMCYGVYIVSLHTSHREDDSSSYAESKVVASDEILYREKKVQIARVRRLFSCSPPQLCISLVIFAFFRALLLLHRPDGDEILAQFFSFFILISFYTHAQPHWRPPIDRLSMNFHLYALYRTIDRALMCCTAPIYANFDRNYAENFQLTSKKRGKKLHTILLDRIWTFLPVDTFGMIVSV